MFCSHETNVKGHLLFLPLWKFLLILKFFRKATAKIGPSVAIFWTSRFGESERLAQLFAHGLTSCSVNVEMHDLRAIDALEITECVGRNQVIVLTAPPGETEEPWAAQRLGAILANLKPKKHQFVVLDSCLGLESSVFDVFFKTQFAWGYCAIRQGE